MIKKGQRRARPTLDLSDEEEDTDVTEIRKKPRINQLTSKLSAPKIPSSTRMTITSNDEDEEEDGLATFKIRKSNLSRKMEKTKKKSEDKPTASQYFAGTADDYSQERMTQMRNEFVVRLTPAVPEPMVTDDDYMDDALSVIPDPAEDEIPMIVDPSKNTAPVIPTEDRIAAIKHKRDMLRQMGVSQNDYISLNTKTSNPAPSTQMVSTSKISPYAASNISPYATAGSKSSAAESNSTLIREDEDDEEEEHDYEGYGNRGARIQFGDPTKMKPKRDNVDSESDSDDDHKTTKKWEDNLLKKVGIKTVVKDGNVIDVSKITEKPAPPPAAFVNYVPPTMEQLTRSIRDKLTIMNSIHSEHAHQLDKIKGELEQSKLKQQVFESKSGSMIDEVEFFRDLKDFCYDLMDCLDAKSTELNGLEKKLNEIGVQVTTQINSVRQRHIYDELEEVRAILSGESRGLEGPDREDRRKERAGLRTRKRERRMQMEHQEPEGWSSDDDEIYEQMKEPFYQQREKIRDSCSALFDDTHEDFSTLRPIAIKFEEWKRRFPESYKQAYGSLSLRKVVETYVTQELMVRWDMFECGPIDFVDLEWYSIFYNYGEGCQKDDEDELFVPNVIAKIIGEKIKFIISNYFSPMSKYSTNKAICLVKELDFVGGVPSVARKLKEVNAAVRSVIETIVDTYIVLFPPPGAPLSVTDFCERQFWSAVKLFVNIFEWFNILPIDFLNEVCIKSLLNFKLLPYLKTSTDTKLVFEACSKIMTAIPDDYMANFNSIPQPLEGFHGFMVSWMKKLVSTPGGQHLTQKMVPFLVQLKDRENSAFFGRAN